MKGQKIELQKGPEWFSITHQLAQEVVKQEKWIRKYFRYTRCCDEVFLQTIINNSVYKKRLYQKGRKEGELPACLRKIDWGRGKPYVWTSKEYEELINSKCFFARKFDPTVDEEIIQKLSNYLLQKKFSGQIKKKGVAST